MSTRCTRPAWLGLVAALAACTGLGVSPVTSEPRTVRLDADAHRTVTVLRDLTWDDRSPARNEITLPAGIYTLEASDDAYWYLRCSTPLEVKQMRGGARIDARRLAGGLMLGKYSFRAVPAAAYIDGDSATTRILIWKLPGAFLAGEGRDWRRSF